MRQLYDSLPDWLQTTVQIVALLAVLLFVRYMLHGSRLTELLTSDDGSCAEYGCDPPGRN